MVHHYRSGSPRKGIYYKFSRVPTLDGVFKWRCKRAECQEEDEEDALLSPEEILERERKKDPTARLLLSCVFLRNYF